MPCYKIVRSIRNTTLKLCADCAKQFLRNAQNYGKSNNGFRTMITHQLTHRCLCVSRRAKTKKARQVRSNEKILLIVFFDCNGVVPCYKIVRSIRNTTLKLCADCAKQFLRNAQNYGKSNNGFRTMITHQLTHRCLCVSLNHRLYRIWPPLTFSSFQN